MRRKLSLTHGHSGAGSSGFKAWNRQGWLRFSSLLGIYVHGGPVTIVCCEGRLYTEDCWVEACGREMGSQMQLMHCGFLAISTGTLIVLIHILICIVLSVHTVFYIYFFTRIPVSAYEPRCSIILVHVVCLTFVSTLVYFDNKIQFNSPWKYFISAS